MWVQDIPYIGKRKKKKRTPRQSYIDKRGHRIRKQGKYEKKDKREMVDQLNMIRYIIMKQMRKTPKNIGREHRWTQIKFLKGLETLKEKNKGIIPLNSCKHKSMTVVVYIISTRRVSQGMTSLNDVITQCNVI